MGHRLIGFAGLPGVGKSAIVTGVARASGVRVLAVDPIEEGLAAAGYDAGPNRLDSAYLVAARQAEHRLSFGQRVIMEACNAEPERRAIWREVAVRAGVPVSWVEVRCAPEEHRRPLAGRQTGFPGVEEPTWPGVEARSVGLEAWDQTRLVLDATEPIEDNVACVLSHLGLAAEA